MNWKRELGRVAMGVTAAFLVLGCGSSDKEPTKPEDKKPEEKKAEGDAGKKAKAQMAACRADLKILATSIQLYEMDHGTLKELKDLDDPNRKGPAVRLADPWGNPYEYWVKRPGSGEKPSRGVASRGPDGQQGTNDDVNLEF